VNVWEAVNNPEARECVPALSDRDLVVVGDVERALADGLQLKRWWEQREAARDYADPFELVRTYNRAERVTGFFDTAPLNGRSFPVLGLVQEMVFDKSKQAAPARVRDELREFVLHYFLRVSSTRQPEAFVSRDQATKASVRRALQPLSFCPERTDSQAGFGYTQLYYKLRGSGHVGKFPAHLQPRIVDLRRLADIYEWVVLRVEIFDFDFNYAPFADGSFSLNVPLNEETFVAISRDFITDRDSPAPGLLGSYGLGYALLKPAPRETIFAYGPGHFEAGFQTIDFVIDDRGESRVRMAFVSNRPTGVLNIDLDPVALGFGFADLMTFGLASRLFGPVRGALEQVSPRLEDFDPVTTYIAFVNLLTGGMAADRLCASLEALEKNPMLLTHFMEHYNLVSGALMTWRLVQDWLDPADIPESVREGTST
jgi:hypothetical protein